MKDKNIIGTFQEKLNLSRSARAEYEEEWDLDEIQFESDTTVDGYGKMKVNAPLEKNLTETYVGKFSGKLRYDIVPIQQSDIDEIQPAKYILDNFLDDDEQKYSFYEEKKNFLFDKGKYGTGIFYTGITYDSEIEPVLSNNADSIFSCKYDEKKVDRWCFTPRNIPIRNIYIDHNALKQNNFNRVKYIIMKENIRPSVLKERYKDVKGFKNLDLVTENPDTTPEYMRQPISNEEAVIYYYFNQETKDYWIIANEDTLLFSGKYFYRNGKLPFVISQHYTRTNCIYGEGIPHRVRTMKGYKNLTLQSMLDKMSISSGINLGLGNNGSIDGELYTGSGEVNIWEFNNSIDQVKQFNLDGNINTQLSILDTLDKLIIQDGGIDVTSAYTQQASTLGQQEIMEENKQVRSASVDENYYLALDKALSDTLRNIRKYAPSLLKVTEKNKSGKVIKEEYPMIKIPNKKIEEKKGKLIIKDDYGKYGWFEFKPNTLKHNMSVKIATLATQSSLKALEKDKVNSYVNQIAILSKFNPEIVMKHINFEQMMKWINNTYGIDNDKLAATTKRDEIIQKNKQLVKELSEGVGVSMVGETPVEQPTKTNVNGIERQTKTEGNPLMNPNERSGLQEGADGLNKILGQINQ